MSNAKTDKELFERVRVLIERGMPWTVIAAAVGKSRKTLENWKNPESKLFNKEFAQMLAEAEEEFASSKIKAGQTVQAVKHKLSTRELRIDGPKRPKSDYTKDMLIWYADDVLDLELDPSMTKNEIWYHIDREIEEQTKEKMVKVREQEVDPSQAAVKNVLTNTGAKDKRWNFKEEVELGFSENLLKDEECENIRDILKKNVG